MRNFALIVLITALLSVSAGQAAEIGPPKGSLVLIGGGIRNQDIIKKVITLAGGPDELILIVPTAMGMDSYDDSFQALRLFRDAGAKNVRLLHTNDRALADTETFAAQIKNARGVYFAGGRHWRLADAYLDTRTHRELERVLERGGVIAGASAGATILGSFLVRGDTKNAEIMVGDHTRGFGFLRNVAVDQHLLRRNRQFDMLPVIESHPELLGLGIDEDAAIVVQQDEFEVIGSSYVVIYDRQRYIPPSGAFYFLAAGDRYNLATRQPVRAIPTTAPLDRVVRRP